MSEVYDPNLLSNIPPDVIQAADKVSQYFADRRIKGWRLGGVMDAGNAELAVSLADIPAITAESINVGPRRDQRRAPSHFRCRPAQVRKARCNTCVDRLP